MRKRLLALFITFAFINAQAQENLSGSRQTSVYTYIYKIKPAEAKLLFGSSMDEYSDKFLHTLVDSFKTGHEYEGRLQTGNYLFVYAKQEEIEVEMHIEDDLQYHTFSNDHDLVISLNTKKGEIISDARVYINKKRIPYDERIKAFRINKRKKGGMVKVYHGDAVHYFALTKEDYYGASWFERALYSFPMVIHLYG